MTSPDPTRPRFVIIGAGASGVLAAHAIAAETPTAEIVVVDPKPGRGVAYGGSQSLHLLNTRASNMALDARSPTHFVDWLNATGTDDHGWTGADFAPRKVFGDYLVCRLRALVAEGRVRLAKDRAVGIAHDRDGWSVRMSDGSSVTGDAVVLATGNARPRPLDFAGRAAIDGLVIDDPWDEAAIAETPAAGTVLLVGTGLTAVDVAVTLLKRPAGPSVVAASRRGLLPRIHDVPHAELPRLPRPFPRTARALYRHVRAFAEEIAGDDVYARHAVFTGMKPDVPEIWAWLPELEKRRFLRHLRPWWEVERHRLAPAIAAILAEGEAHGRFETARGRIVSAEPAANGASVTLACGPSRRTLEVTRIVNCTGPDWRVGRGDQLLGGLLEQGAKTDAMGLGLDVDQACEVQGERGPLTGLFAIGPLTRGTFFESTAVPEIRAQAERVARRLAALSRVAKTAKASRRTLIGAR